MRRQSLQRRRRVPREIFERSTQLGRAQMAGGDARRVEGHVAVDDLVVTDAAVGSARGFGAGRGFGSCLVGRSWCASVQGAVRPLLVVLVPDKQVTDTKRDTRVLGGYDFHAALACRPLRPSPGRPASQGTPANCARIVGSVESGADVGKPLSGSRIGTFGADLANPDEPVRGEIQGPPYLDQGE